MSMILLAFDFIIGAISVWHISTSRNDTELFSGLLGLALTVVIVIVALA